VVPAHGRFPVTELALSQHQHLVGELGVRGITANVVVVADDENLDVAEEFGFWAAERPNVLGLKLNDGFEFAASKGADWLCFCGSDNWVHPDVFDGLGGCDGSQVLAGHQESVVDLKSGRMRVLNVGYPGTAPWLIPRALLEPLGFRPVEDEKKRAMELALVIAMGHPEFVFHDPNRVARVDFKSDVGLTTYAGVAHLGGREEDDPWPVLRANYPADLVDAAQELSVWYAGAAA
jgi:hypothetical protein